MTFTAITIIYNPNSTGASKDLAHDFTAELRKRLPKHNILLIATEHTGHAEELAYKLATSSKRPLIISSSGDGGYHEVVNGALRAQREGAQPTTGLLPAGNANDHYRNLHDNDTIEAVVSGEVRQIDVMKFTSTSKGKPIERYAHSYIGFGVTPHVGKELNKQKLTFFNQIVIVLRALFATRSIPLKMGTKVGHYDSVIISNIDQMSKVLKVSQPSRVTDGLCEITIFRRAHKLKLIASLLQATIAGVKEDKRVKELSLKTVVQTLVQLDGEMYTLDAGSNVAILVEQQSLRCIV